MSANLKTEQIILRIVGGRFSGIAIMAITTSSSVSVGFASARLPRGCAEAFGMLPNVYNQPLPDAIAQGSLPARLPPYPPWSQPKATSKPPQSLLIAT